MKLIGKIVHIEEHWALFLSNAGKKHKLKIKNLNRALYNDEVEVELVKRNSKVINIIQRSNPRYIGIYEKNAQHAFVRTKGQQCYTDFFIAAKDSLDAKHGDVVEAVFKKWTDKDRSPCGKIVNITSESNISEKLLFKHQIPYHFSKNVLDEANDIKIKESHLDGRTDLTHLKCYTIDPKNSRDFDDAVSLEKIDDYYRVGIHIADVTSLLDENSLLDLEALRRAFTLYLPNAVVPMIPHRLSNGIFSLKQDDPKLTISLLLDVDKKYKIVNQIFTQSIINVNQNFTYQQVNNILEDAKHDDHEYFATLNKIAKNIVKTKRLRVIESKLKLELDEQNNFIPVVKEKKDAERIIEELMILTNTTIANELAKYYPKSILRTHDSPSKFKLTQLKSISEKLGYKIEDKDIYDQLYQLLENNTANHSHLISYYLLTAQQKAIYSTHSKGHFALNLPYYTHFTSPIRRYSDIMVHRMVIKILKHKKKKESNLYHKINWINEKEQLINDIERKVFHQQIFEYLNDCTDTIDGQIIDINNRHFKVRSAFFVNGIIKKNKSTRPHQLGEFLKLKVDKIDKKHKKVEFIETE